MTSFFAWNMRGFNSPRKHRVIRNWVQAEKPLFGCIVETHVQEECHGRNLTEVFPGWSSMTNYEFHRLGRIWFCFSDLVEVTLLHKTAQIITCAIWLRETGNVFMCSAVYASNFESDRRHLWDDIRATRLAYDYLAIPWILIGDYNEILATNEHSRGYDQFTNQVGMGRFQSLVTDCDLSDLSAVGSMFTWWNNRAGDPIGKKLDRALVNGHWLHSFPLSYANFEAGGISDHARCLIRLQQQTSVTRKPFKFFNFLTGHQQFLQTVATIWNGHSPIHHSRLALYRFHKQLKGLKFAIRALNRTQYGDLPNRTSTAFADLCALQQQVLITPTTAATEASDKWHHLASVEEKFYKQRSCIQWLKSGDQNSSFYHRIVKDRKAENGIKILVTKAGETLTLQSDIKKEVVSHFQRFLQTQPYASLDVSVEALQDLLTYRCPGPGKAALLAPVVASEIWHALHSLPNDKVPGPDGYTKEFYIAAWPVIERDFVVAVQSFFLYGFMPKAINATILSLIPKTETAATMKDYRPIACCNLLYKVISKILANRLKRLLPEAIEPNQSAFIKGHLLLENVLLASELVNGYHKESISDRCAIKFDISKAFDTVKWSFITNVLRAMGLLDQFIHWIRVCISTASFSVCVNGDLEGFFSSARGIRQGCSLSPYLYVILNNVLSKMLNQAAADGLFGYHPKCKEIGITHLSFADDILVFTDGSPTSLRGVLNIMNTFALYSGLHINAAKSSIFTTGQGSLGLHAAAISAGIEIGILPIRYLGLPLTTKRLTKLDFEPLVDKIRFRFLSWTHKSLSFAGRLQLIKTVIYSITNFWCQAFILPKNCLTTIESMCCAFLWSGSPTDTHKVKVSWEEVCYPQTEGGLGIRRLQDSTRVFALSLIWRLFTLSGSLWVDWIRVHLLRNGSFWDVRETQLGSWIWRKLLKLRHVAYQFMRSQVHSGYDTFFWFDNWLQKGKLIDITGEHGIRHMGIPRNARVSDAVTNETWGLRRCRGRVYQVLLDTIHSQSVPNATGKDEVLWKHGPDDYRNSFSAAKTWDQIRSTRPAVAWNKVIWFPQAVPRFAFFAWLTVKNRLATGVRMRAWGVVQGCLLCGEPEESRDHLFFACPFSYTVWTDLGGRLLGSGATPDWEDTLEFMTHHPRGALDVILLRLLFQSMIYHIWRERNFRRHQRGCNTSQQLTIVIDRSIRNRITSLNYKFPHKLEELRRRWFEVSSLSRVG